MILWTIGEDVSFIYSTFILDRAEYAKICREINTNYIKRNPCVKSADVIKFVSDQPDFADDAAYMRVG